jgi:asparagine synthase (glutamine-hydrolysing)
MCGIAGIYRPGGEAPRAELEAMAAALGHRGPDAHGLWFDGPIGLAHTRLKIVDLSERAAQPMTSRSGALRLTYNGEIYNHRRLRPELERRGVSFRSTSDTEVLLEGYAEHGDAFIERCEGMFAFALWDGARQRLLLGRDRAGEKPLFYMPLARGGVAFASEIKALCAVRSLGVERDLDQLPAFLVHGYVPPPATSYKGVLQLEPGHLAAFSEGPSAPPRRYWAPSFSPPPSRPAPTYDDAKRELRERMKQIVSDRLDADVPVGAFLSGGLDSATVVGVATRDLGREVHTYSIGFEDKAMDESGDARISARHLGSVHEEFIVSERDMPPIELLVRHHDGPFGDSSAIPTYLVSKMARSRVTVAVTGDGGDELFGGYPRFIGGVLGEHVPRWAGRFGQDLAQAALVVGRATGADLTNSRSPVARAGRFAAAMERPLEHRILHWNAVFPPASVGGLLPGPGPGPGRGAAFDPRSLTRYNDVVFSETVGQPPLARMLHHNFRTYLPEDLLVKVDRCSMAVSLETRSPLLDSGLIDFVGGLPDSFKVRGLTTKRILRDTFRDLLAPELLSRPKRGFGVPLAGWLDGPLAAGLNSALRGESPELYRHLDRTAVERALWGPGPLDAVRAYQAWALWTLEVWLKQPLSPAA